MSTRCRIGKLNENGTVTSIYCHHDGYPRYVGKKLVDFYDNNNIDQLLDLGDLSMLGNNPVSSANAWKSGYSEEYSLAYNDRGEHTHKRVHTSIKDYLEFCDNQCDIEYAYILKDNKWYYSNMCSTKEEDLRSIMGD